MYKEPRCGRNITTGLFLFLGGLLGQPFTFSIDECTHVTDLYSGIAEYLESTVPCTAAKRQVFAQYTRHGIERLVKRFFNGLQNFCVHHHSAKPAARYLEQFVLGIVCVYFCFTGWFTVTVCNIHGLVDARLGRKSPREANPAYHVRTVIQVLCHAPHHIWHEIHVAVNDVRSDRGRGLAVFLFLRSCRGAPPFHASAP